MKKIISILMLLIFSVTAYAVSYNDLEGFDWAEEAIYALTEDGTLNGMGDGTFCPDDNVTREQLAKMVAPKVEEPLVSTSFSDVSSDRWSYDAIKKTHSYFNYDKTLFMPEEDATREECALVITKAVFGDILSGIKPTEKEFSDIDSVSEKSVIKKAVSLGIIEGYPDGTFLPQGSVTRAECAVMLHRANEKKKELDTPVKEEEEAEPEKEVEAEKVGNLDDLDVRTNFFVVKSVSNISATDTKRITGESDKKEYALDIPDAKVESLISEDNFIQKGDVLQIIKDANGRIFKAYIVFSPRYVYDDDENVINPVNERGKVIVSTSKTQHYAYGLVRALSGVKISLAFDNLEEISEVFKIEQEPDVYVFSNGKVYDGTEDDIMYDKTVGEQSYSEDASFVFLRAHNNVVTDIYVVE